MNAPVTLPAGLYRASEAATMLQRGGTSIPLEHTQLTVLAFSGFYSFYSQLRSQCNAVLRQQ